MPPPVPVSAFHPLIQTWFASRFDAPTEPQSRGWPAIAAGDHTLIAAPTGSGKTLAAFLAIIDRLLKSILWLLMVFVSSLSLSIAAGYHPAPYQSAVASSRVG